MGVDFTVFTPTYNRAHVLVRSYEALKCQTDKEFVWLIVDDGSTDGTKALIDSWIQENIIPIQYIYQKNAGKQSAVNAGVKNCRTAYFGFLDSDDYYLPTTVENFKKHFAEIRDNPRIAGVLARRGKPDGQIAGNPNIPNGPFVMNFDTLYRKFRFSGDTCRAYRTEVLRRFLYPKIEDKFIPESVMLSAIDREYDLLIINKPYSISEYLSDGYTHNSHRLYHKNPLGYALGISQLTISRRGIHRQVKYTVMYIVWCRVKRLDRAFSRINNKPMYVLVWPLSCICYFLKWPGWMFDSPGL